jgi:hypothetical protein
MISPARLSWAGWLVGVLVVYVVARLALLLSACGAERGCADLVDLNLPGYSLLRRLQPSGGSYRLMRCAPASVASAASQTITHSIARRLCWSRSD